MAATTTPLLIAVKFTAFVALLFLKTHRKKFFVEMPFLGGQEMEDAKRKLSTKSSSREGDSNMPFSRRALLQGALGGAAPLALGASKSEAAKSGTAPYGPFKMGIQAISLRHINLDEASTSPSSL